MNSPPLSIEWLRERRIALAMGVVLAVLYLLLFAFKSYFEIELQTFAGKGTFFKVYWADADQDYTESKSKRLRIRGGNYNIKLFLGNLGNIGKLRIDPIEYVGEAKIKSISLSQKGYDSIRLAGNQLNRVLPLNQIESVKLETDGLRITSSGKDGNLELQIFPNPSGGFQWIHLINALIIVLGCVALRRPVALLQQQHRYVMVGLTVALALAAVMASITTIHVHPDERVHLEAVNYYSKHALPPSLDSPEIVNSFSDYGKSRLSTYEIYYPLAGYFSRLLGPIKSPELLNARAFSVCLLLGLLLLSFARSKFRYFALPLIISPQIWYLFSYPNSDSFALAACLIAAYQIAVSDSLLNRFLSEHRPNNYVLSLLGFGGLAGVLLLTKLNFYFFLLFLFLYLLWRQTNGFYPRPGRMWIRVLMLGVIAASMYGTRIGLDYAANGPDPKAKFNEYLELTAKDEFKPSTPLEKKHVYLYLKQRGNELDVVLQFLNWGSITFATAFGSYGYTQYFGSDTYFAVMKALVLLLLGAIVFYALVKGPPELHGLILIAGLCASLLISASIWSSWTENFQAQGRYMAPLIPILAVVYYHARHFVNYKVVSSIALALFVMSVYSFVFIGLVHIAKTSFYTGVG
ncbi:MAG: hypothetical protein P8Y12_02540 [Gammaproteobacteria bacterium]